ncbi:MAG TPA: BamA/TamA family outer membrane protein [Armatimonadota bacterium]|jgi:outer membrane protein insertion porin family
MTRIRRVAMLCAALIAVFLGLRGTPVAAQAGTVGDVAVVGNVNISREAILAVVSIKPGSPFSVEAATRDVAAIRDLGFFQRVTHHEEDTVSGTRVIFEVTENPRITDIKITGNTKISTQDLLNLMITKKGDVLNVSRLGKDLDRIGQAYKDRGYLAFVDIQDNYISPEGVLSIPVVEVKIERFEVEKKGKTKPYVILREIETKPGSVYDGNKLRDDLYRVFNLGILEDIQYRTEPGSTQDKIIIVLQPTEKKTGQVELGFGYSSQQGLIGRAGISDSNLKGTGKSLGLSLEIGGRYRSAGVPPLSVETNYYQPYIDKHRTSFSASLYNKTTYRFTNTVVGSVSSSGQAYEVRGGGSLGFGRPVSRNSRVILSLRDDNIRTYSPEDTSVSSGLLLDTQRTSNVASVGLSLVTDTRDDKQYDPSTGSLFTVGAEVGHTRLGGDTQVFRTFTSNSGMFVKPALDYRRYFALAKRKAINVPTKVFAFRLKGGVATGPLTFFDQYFVGGADSLRGFQEDRFWGKKSLLANAELRMPFASNLQGVLFFDAGDAWGSTLRGDPKRYADYKNWADNGYDSNGDGIPDPPPTPYTIYDAYEYRMPQHDAFKLNTGVGFGIRVKTPIGPLRLDYGISKEGKRTHFSISQTF